MHEDCFNSSFVFQHTKRHLSLYAISKFDWLPLNSVHFVLTHAGIAVPASVAQTVGEKAIWNSVCRMD